MSRKTGLLILTVLLAILLTDNLNLGQKVIAANPQEEGETCTVNKSAKLRNGKRARLLRLWQKAQKFLSWVAVCKAGIKFASNAEKKQSPETLI